MNVTLVVGSYKTLLQVSNPKLRAEIRRLLSYEDRNIKFMNFKCGLSRDPTRSLLGRDNRFYSGLVGLVVSHCRSLGANVTVQDRRKRVTPESLLLPDHLRPHQIEIIQTMLRHNRGIIESPTGSGKTIAAAWFLMHFPNSRILFTVPETALMKKTALVFTEMFDEPIGQVGGGKKQFERITVGVINSLAKAESELNDIAVIVHDEAHRAANSYYDTLARKCPNAYYIYGLTATAFRDSGDTLRMQGLCGPVRLKISETNLIQNGDVILSPECYFLNDVPKPAILYNHAAVHHSSTDPDSTYVTYNTPSGQPDLSDVYKKAVVEYDVRNRHILTVLQLFLKWPARTGAALVLVERTQHGIILSETARAMGFTLPFISGNASADERQYWVQALNANLEPCLCTSSIFNEGQDIPTLQMVIIACAGANRRRIIQQVGRVVRTAANKSRAFVFDIADKETYYLRRHALIRQRAIESRYGNCVTLIRLADVEKLFAAAPPAC